MDIQAAPSILIWMCHYFFRVSHKLPIYSAYRRIYWYWFDRNNGFRRLTSYSLFIFSSVFFFKDCLLYSCTVSRVYHDRWSCQICNLVNPFENKNYFKVSCYEIERKIMSFRSHAVSSACLVKASKWKKKWKKNSHSYIYIHKRYTESRLKNNCHASNGEKLFKNRRTWRLIIIQPVLK